MGVCCVEVDTELPGTTDANGEDPDGATVDETKTGGETGGETTGLSPAVIGGAAAGFVLLLLGIGSFVWGRRKKTYNPDMV